MGSYFKAGRRAKPGNRFVFGGGLLNAEIVDIVEQGNRLVRFEYDGIFEQILDKVGSVPLPPYITKRLDDPERYQTVYSKHKGSAAALRQGSILQTSCWKSLSKKVWALLMLHSMWVSAPSGR
jgi:S-adenosylmethionine:tRNA ribosyltransferase-isomerase